MRTLQWEFQVFKICVKQCIISIMHSMPILWNTCDAKGKYIPPPCSITETKQRELELRFEEPLKGTWHNGQKIVQHNLYPYTRETVCHIMKLLMLSNIIFTSLLIWSMKNATSSQFLIICLWVNLQIKCNLTFSFPPL